MKTLQTPTKLSESTSTMEFKLPAYDWKKQTRHDTIVAGKYTSASLQTFDSKGQPKDSQSDNND
jgi:hypothetical protein